jgi:hypothetical protein
LALWYLIISSNWHPTHHSALPYGHRAGAAFGSGGRFTAMAVAQKIVMSGLPTAWWTLWRRNRLRPSRLYKRHAQNQKKSCQNH